MYTDAWRDLPVADYFTRPAADRPGEPDGAASRKEHGSGKSEDHKYFGQHCEDTYRELGREPGTRLWWAPAGVLRRELRTAQQQALASARVNLGYGMLDVPQWSTVSMGGRIFTLKRVKVAARPDIAEVIARSISEGCPRRRVAGPKQVAGRPGGGLPDQVLQLLDEAGAPVFYVSGAHISGYAGTLITFPDQRWLGFPVRGTKLSSKWAIMTAVDQAGRKAARYRFVHAGSRLRLAVEITVHPDRQLTDELVLAIAVSAGWFREYYWGGGGG
jgi:hypothetical protein